MSSVYFVVEGRSDADILRRLLRPSVLRKIELVVGDGKSSAISTARTLLAIGNRPVGLLVDADTTHPREVAHEHQTISELLRRAAHGSEYQVFQAVPDLGFVFARRHVFAHRGAVSNIPLVRDIIMFVKSNTN
jgi:hypothetical protein